MDLPDSELSQDIQLVTGDSARVNFETEASTAFFSDSRVESTHVFHPGGPFRGQGRELDVQGLGRSRGRQGAQQAQRKA